MSNINPGDKFLLHDKNGHDYYITILYADDIMPEKMKYSAILEDENGRNIFEKYGNRFFCGDWLLEHCEKIEELPYEELPYYERLIKRLLNPTIIAESDWHYLCREAAGVIIDLLRKRPSIHEYVEDITSRLTIDFWMETEKEFLDANNHGGMWAICLYAIEKLFNYYNNKSGSNKG